MMDAHRLLLFIALTTSASSCALDELSISNAQLAQSSGPQKRDPNAPLSIREPENWVGTKLGLADDTWEDLGQITVAATPDRESLAREISPIPTKDFVDVDSNEGTPNFQPKIDDLRYVGFDLKNHRAYRLTVKGHSASAISEAMKARGVRAGSIGGRAPTVDHATQEINAGVASAAPSGSESWSDGIDNRTRRTSLDGVSWDAYPERLTGELVGRGCTGTLVGRRVVLTAAHCLVNNQLPGWNPFFNTFIPRSDPFTLVPPFGVIDSVWYWVPEMYLNGLCGTDQGVCNKYDFGIIVLDDAFGGVGWHPGWSAYDVPVNGGIGSGYQMWGYPGCTEPEAPVPCTDSALYGDVNACDFGAIASFEDAWNWFPREGLVSCDGGRGQSGSSLFRMDGGIPVAIGQFNQFSCIAAACIGQHYTTVFGLISPNYGASLDYFIANNP